MAWIALIVGLILLLVFPKRMGVVLAVALAAGVGLYLYVDHRERVEREARDNVVVKVQYGPEKCPPGRPLSVVIDNATDRTVRSIEFQLEIRRPGYSSNLIDGYGAGTFSSDRIIKPKEGHSFCHGAPKLRGNPALKDLEYSVGFKDISFAD
ncbi:MAG: hypothetical protein ACT4P3_19125 [Betaproteobacteria bacterium]